MSERLRHHGNALHRRASPALPHVRHQTSQKDHPRCPDPAKCGPLILACRQTGQGLHRVLTAARGCGACCLSPFPFRRQGMGTHGVDQERRPVVKALLRPGQPIRHPLRVSLSRLISQRFWRQSSSFRCAGRRWHREPERSARGGIPNNPFLRRPRTCPDGEPCHVQVPS